jgi:hypothetical protein
VIARINHTGRKRISREHAAVLIHERMDASPTCDVNVDLRSYGLPADARVCLEAQRQTSWMRFDLGRLDALAPVTGLELTEFATADALLFRIRVTANSQSKKLLLAEVDSLHPVNASGVTSSGREPLLPVKPADLSGEIWRIDIEPRPILLINRLYGAWRSLVQEPMFVALVFPAAMRLVLKNADLDVEHDEDSWQRKWIRFAEAVPGASGVPPSRDTAALEEWIDDVVAAFCRSKKMLERLIGATGRGEER